MANKVLIEPINEPIKVIVRGKLWKIDKPTSVPDEDVKEFLNTGKLKLVKEEKNKEQKEIKKGD
ncbi:MAG: hypothetical protein RBR14_06520 [Candidatus Cloacimonas acidaminovorans]|nr:hypothetical protein [Candidatus Cloacimonas acidaminovorans]